MLEFQARFLLPCNIRLSKTYRHIVCSYHFLYARNCLVCIEMHFRIVCGNVFLYHMRGHLECCLILSEVNKEAVNTKSSY